MLDDKEYSDYEESLHNLWDITNAMSDAEMKGYGKGKEAGMAEGRAEGRAEGARQQALAIARKMLAKGMSFEEICEMTGLHADEISEI